MSMRKWKRIMAHKHMENKNISHINKPIKFANRVYPSYFASNWRDFITVKRK